MHRFASKPISPSNAMEQNASDPAKPETPPDAAENSLGWSIALSVWVIAFIVLVLFELWNFVYPLIRGLFR